MPTLGGIHAVFGLRLRVSGFRGFGVSGFRGLGFRVAGLGFAVKGHCHGLPASAVQAS